MTALTVEQLADRLEAVHQQYGDLVLNHLGIKQHEGISQGISRLHETCVADRLMQLPTRAIRPVLDKIEQSSLESLSHQIDVAIRQIQEPIGRAYGISRPRCARERVAV